ncbi:MAG TPA: LysR family transcriptional regulator, partial [Clostridium sp.]|nr:LysR family transcriptional regulator [Clostridium sp.]
EPAINLIQKGENQLLEANTLNGGQLRIGASDTICRYYLVPYLNKFHKTYPNVHIKVTNQTSIECAHLLESGQVDFIITNYPNSGLLSSQNTRVINEFSDVFVANQEYFPLKGQTVSLGTLQTYPILMLERKSTTSEFLHHMFQKEQLDLVPEIELSSNDLLIDLAGIGLGIAFVPDFCIPENDRDLFQVKLSEKLPTRQMVVAYNENIPVSQASKQFMDML